MYKALNARLKILAAICVTLSMTACLFGGSSGSSSSSPSPSPSAWDQYVSDFQQQMDTARTQISGMSQPHIPKGAAHMPGSWGEVNYDKTVCDPSKLAGQANACIWNNITVLNAYTDALAAAGVGVIDWQLDPVVLSAATQYTGSIASDCPGGWRCKTLANYDSLVSHAVAKGLKIHLRPVPDTLITPCGLTSASTEADYEACMKPLEVAAVTRWGADIDSVTMLHEAVGEFSNAVPFHSSVTTAWVKTFLDNTASALKTASGTVKVGACAETMFASDATYFNSYITNANLNYVCVDLYGSKCDVNQYVNTTLATAVSWANAANAQGMDIRLEESARPRYLASNCSGPEESNAIEHAGYSDYSTSGVDVLWLQTIVPFVAAYGYSGYSTYDGQLLIWYTTDINNAEPDNPGIPSFNYNILPNLTDTSATGVAFSGL